MSSPWRLNFKRRPIRWLADCGRSKFADRWNLIPAGAVLAWALVTTVLAACSPHKAEQRFSDYETRLSRPLDLVVTKGLALRPPVPPRVGELQIPIRASSIDGLDFLRLRGCALQHTVARRNSSLGKVAPPSQRLILELDFLRQAPDCIAKLQDDANNELAALLQASVEQKRDQLPAMIFNATLASTEFRRFWRDVESLSEYPTNTSSIPITALEFLLHNSTRWLRGDYAVDGLELELALSDVALGDGAELLAALQMQYDALDALSLAIEQRASSRPLCDQGLKPSSAETTRNVVTRYFVGTIQPWSAAINQRYHELLPLIEQLEATLSDHLPEIYQNWKGQRTEFTALAIRAPAEHVTALQTLLGSCFAEFRPVVE